MSTWRRKGLELFYDIRFRFTGPEDTIYDLLLELRSRVIEAHNKNDLAELEKIYNFAEWCFKQEKRSFYLCNAIAVGFYEHLVDEEITRKEIPSRIKPYIFNELKPLYQWMLQDKEEQYRKLIIEYNKINNTRFEC